MRILLLFLFFSGCPLLSSYCFSQDYLSLQKEAEQSFSKNDFQNALAIGQSALDQAELTVGKSHHDYAKILSDVGVYNSYAGNSEKAITQMEEALALFKNLAGEKSKEYNETQENFASVLMFAGDYSRAEQLLLQGAALDAELYGQESRERAVALCNLAVIQEQLKKISEAEKNLLTGKDIFIKKNLTDSLEYASLINTLASVYQDKKDLLKAEQCYKISAKVYKKNGLEKSLDYSIIIQNLGTLYMDMGRYDDARVMMLKDIEMKKEFAGEESPEYSSSLNNLANLYSTLGNYSESESLYSRSLALKEKILGKEHPSYLLTQNNLAMVLYDLGRTEEGISLQQKCISAARKEKISNPVDYAFYASNLAHLYSSSGNYVEGEKYYKEAIEIYKEQYGEVFGDYTAELSNLAVVYMSMDEDKKAKELLLKAADIAKSAGQYESKENLELLNNLACAYHDGKELDRSVSLMRDVVKIAKDVYSENHPKYVFYLFNLAIFIDEQNNNAEAEQVYEQVIKSDFFNLRNNFSTLSENEKSEFYSTLSVHFDAFYRFALERAKENPAILSKVMDYRLATKSMLLNTSAKIRNTIFQSKDSALINTYLRWKSQKDYLVKLYSLGKRELALMQIKPDSIERSVNDLEKQLSVKTDLLSRSFNPDISWKQVQHELQPDEAAVEIIRVYSPFADEKDKVFYIALIVDKDTKNNPSMAVMEDGYEMESKYTKEYRDAVFDTSKKENTYVHFWEKIEKELNGKRKIYLSSDGVYAKINLNSVKDPATRSFLIDGYDFHYVTTLRDLIGWKNETSPSVKTAALFGYPDYTFNYIPDKNHSSTADPLSAAYLLERKKQNAGTFYLDPLPGTKKEVESISKLMKEKGWQAATFISSAADEQKLKSLSSPAVLHIATHGYFLNDVDASFTPATSLLASKMSKNPLLRSGLMMAGASNAFSKNYGNISNWSEQEDGILTAYEAMNLNLDKTELVVLSACETGLGEIRNGEGVYGLQRAFMTAGAKTLIMSLWSVSDEATQKLMTLFYSKWLETGDKHSAFRYAQLELKKTFPDPYFWSAFVMIEK